MSPLVQQLSGQVYSVMYLSKSELDSLLKKDYFTTFLHTNVTKYALYRGHYNANVLTLRYSVLSPSFTENDMIQSCITETMKFFSPKQKSVRGLIEYDFVLKADQQSYYFWRANSNRTPLPNSETILSLTYDDIFLFIQNVAYPNPSDFDIFFANSNVSVDMITSVIFTFISV